MMLRTRRKRSPTHHVLLCFSSAFLVLLSSGHHQWSAVAQNNTAAPPNGGGSGGSSSSNSAWTPFNVGVILDVGSWIGNVSWSCISMAVEDFYAAHRNYSTKLVLHLRDSDKGAVGAASAAVDLLKNVQVQAIIGPQTSTQAKFVMELGNRSQVPIISFSAKSPSLSSTLTPYFVRTALNDSSQVKAIAAMVQTFGWREVVPVFEDTEYGNGIVPYLIDSFQDIGASVPYRSIIPLSATNDRILKELYKLKTMQTRIFVVHMSYSLGFQFFSNAKEAGMMGKGYVWITTYGLTCISDILGSSAINAMQGVLGVKPYVRETRKLDEFKVRWRKRFLLDNPNAELPEPTVLGLWAYDTVWALAMAAENVRVQNFSYLNVDMTNSSTELAHLGLSPIGPKLLRSILTTNFSGISGNFHLIEGQLDSTTFEIVNVIGNGKRRIGFWTPVHGISRHMDSKADLKVIMWPGESMTVPKGWEWPTNEKTLKIGVPVKPGFSEFVNMERDPLTNRYVGTGFCIEVFDAVIAALPYAVPYEYIPYADAEGNSNGTYDDLVYQVYLQKFDAVVGDITIIANRSQYVDFTLPYTESGVSMVVPIKDDRSKSAWIFADPLTTDLWLASGVFFVFTGFVVWVLEHRINEEFRGEPTYQLGTVFYFAFSTLVFAHREKLVNNLSRFVVIIWVFVVLILTSSYTASLTSMLTVRQLQPTVADLNELIRKGDRVGYLNDSFMPGLLELLKFFNQSKLIAYNSPAEYAEALTKGSLNGGVGAIFDEIPYIKVFLSEYCGKYTMVGPTYKTDGFGFVFPMGSPLVPDVSRAILKVMEGDHMVDLEKKLYGDQACSDQSSTVVSNSLSLDSFWGLFLVTGIASTSALFLFSVSFLYENRHVLHTLGSGNSLLRRLALFARFYDQRDPSSHDFKKSPEPKDEQMAGVGGIMDSSFVSNEPQSPSSLSNHTYGNFDDVEEEIGSPLEGEGTPGREISSQNPDPPSFAEMLNPRG